MMVGQQTKSRFTPEEVTLLSSEAFTIPKNMGNGDVFQYQAGYHADPCLGYALMLFWDKMGNL